jgi:hypothetical protein
MNSEHELLVASSTSAEVNGGHFAELVQLEVLIEAASNSTNEYLTRSLMEKYSLLEHLRALKRFLLLGQVRMTMEPRVSTSKPLTLDLCRETSSST